MPQAELSIIVPALHYPKVGTVVRSLLNQRDAGGEIPDRSYEIIVSDNHTGAWKEKLLTLAQEQPSVPVRYVQTECTRHWRSREINAGLAASSGRIVVFLAGDFFPGPGFVRAHFAFHEQHPARHVVAIGNNHFVASQASDPFVRWLETSGSLFGAQFKAGDANGFFYCGNVSLKRSFLDECGGFDERFRYDTVDDFELGVRLRAAGMQSIHIPDAEVAHEHDHTVTLAERLEAMRLTGESAALVEQKHPGTYEWSEITHLSPARIRLRAAVWGILYLLRRRESDLHCYYSTRCSAAFAEGRRRALRALQS